MTRGELLCAAAGLLSAALFIDGCHLVYPLDPSRQDADTRGLDRGALTRDQRRSDLLDQSLDQPRDLPLDQLSTDQTRIDQAGSDATSPDLTMADLHLLGACANQATESAVVGWTNMVRCSKLLVNQCDAVSLCNANSGWHLCTATEYLARGGKTQGADDHWLAGCVRGSSGKVTAPVDGICASGCPFTSSSLIYSYFCIGSIPVSPVGNLYVGLTTYVGCARPGQDKPNVEGYWTAQGITTSGRGAVCCN